MPVILIPDISNRYRGYDARLDSEFPGLKSVEWTYTNPPFMGMGPVLDLKTRDIACQKAAKPPNLKAVSRAGAEVTFYWTPYYQQHKGPIFTVRSKTHSLLTESMCSPMQYLGRLEDPNQDITTVKFFKIDEATKKKGSSKFYRSNNMIVSHQSYSQMG
jgi:hypothetical protein